MRMTIVTSTSFSSRQKFLSITSSIAYELMKKNGEEQEEAVEKNNPTTVLYSPNRAAIGQKCAYFVKSNEGVSKYKNAIILSC